MTEGLPERGEIRWALVPHAVEAPFGGPGWDGGLDFAGVTAHARDAGTRAPLALTLPAVIRPVLLLQGWEGAPHGAYAVLRTRRLDALSPAARDAVQAGTSPDLVLLDGVSAGHRRVAMIAGVSRVHGSALDTTIAGRASAATLRSIDERLADSLSLDLDRLVERRVEAVIADLDLA